MIESEAAGNAHDWLREALKGTAEQRWGSGNLPHGTLWMPRRRLWADETVTVPFRHCLQGADLHTLKLHGLAAGMSFPRGETLLRSGMDWSAQRDAREGRPVDYNGNFGTVWRDFFVDCHHVARGIEFGGAQCSSLQNVTIRHAYAVALKVLNGSTRVRIADVDIETGEPSAAGGAGERIGTGVLLDRCRGVLLENVNLHCLDRGLEVKDGASVTVMNPTLEKVNSVKISGLGVSMIGMNWQWPGLTPFDFTGNPGGTRIEVCLSKLPGPRLYYLDNRGNRQELVEVSQQFMGARQVALRIQTGWSRWWKRLTVSVEAQSWSG